MAVKTIKANASARGTRGKAKSIAARTPAARTPVPGGVAQAKATHTLREASTTSSKRARKAAGVDPIEQARRICGALPEVSEKISHGEPAWFVKGKMFVMFANDHHHDGRIALWMAAPPGAQLMLVEDEPDRFFVPPYVGYRGWVGVMLDANSDSEVAHRVGEAWSTVAPKKLVAALAAATG